MTPISETVGAARISGAQAIPYPTGNPQLPPEKEEARQREIVCNALELLLKKSSLAEKILRGQAARAYISCYAGETV